MTRAVLLSFFMALLIACERDEQAATSSAPAESAQEQRAATAPAISIDDNRLVSADSDQANWLLHGRTYSEQRFSPLLQINSANVDELELAWSHELRTDRGVEATPIVVDGVMYVTGPWSIVYAIDASTGEELWVYDPEVPKAHGQKACCDVVNRGVAIWGDKVYVGTLDGRLVALDAGSGAEAWDVVTVDQSKAYTITGAPRVARGLVFIGNGGAEYGVRGYISAYDAETGELRWRFYTVPGNPADGPDGAASDPALAGFGALTWSGEWWKYGGGGTVWDSIVYDPETGILYVGVGNGSPWDQNIRSPGGGDNLFLSSILALNAETGDYVWHYQSTPGDNWDHTATQQIMLAELEINGEPRKVLLQAPKNGFFYVLDRISGELISAEPYTPVTWATRIDSVTGRPVEKRGARYGKEPVMLKPGPIGGHNWQPMSYSRLTGLVYIPVIDTSYAWSADPMFRQIPGWWNTGVPGPLLPTDPEGLEQARQGSRSFLRAWDPVAQKEVWSVELIGPWNGGTLTTAGQLVFQGTADGRFVAYAADSGLKLWERRTNTATLAGPISYAVAGDQYIAVPGGFGSVMFLALGLVMPDAVPGQRGRVFAYKLGGEAELPEVPELERVMPPPPVIAASAGMLQRGSDVYQYFCFQCHGANAVGAGVLPDLRRSALLRDAKAWAAVVLEGERADQGMGNFGDWISDGDAEALRAYVAQEAARVTPAK